MFTYIPMLFLIKDKSVKFVYFQAATLINPITLTWNLRLKVAILPNMTQSRLLMLLPFS